MSTPHLFPVSNEAQDIPPLEPGDRLTREEFERRYEAMPHLKKAELIEGVVYMPSPVRWDYHGQPHSLIMGWLVDYWAETPGVSIGDNTSLRLGQENEPQPDAMLFIRAACGGQAEMGNDGIIEGAPELVGEVAATSASFDLNTKLQVYQRFGVKEYLVWRVRDRQVDWFVLRGNQFERLAPDGEGLLRSQVFPGLWLDPEALVRENPSRVLAVVRQGVASPEHAAFVQKLQQASGQHE